ncbi:hypothetical protein EV182_006549, partial [Spiromyces aspiralis]
GGEYEVLLGQPWQRLARLKSENRPDGSLWCTVQDAETDQEVAFCAVPTVNKKAYQANGDLPRINQVEHTVGWVTAEVDLIDALHDNELLEDTISACARSEKTPVQVDNSSLSEPVGTYIGGQHCQVAEGPTAKPTGIGTRSATIDKPDKEHMIAITIQEEQEITDQWADPYEIAEAHGSGSDSLAESVRTPSQSPIAGYHLKDFFIRASASPDSSSAGEDVMGIGGTVVPQGDRGSAEG